MWPMATDNVATYILFLKDFAYSRAVTGKNGFIFTFLTLIRETSGFHSLPNLTILFPSMALPWDIWNTKNLPRRTTLIILSGLRSLGDISELDNTLWSLSALPFGHFRAWSLAMIPIMQTLSRKYSRFEINREWVICPGTVLEGTLLTWAIALHGHPYPDSPH